VSAIADRSEPEQLRLWAGSALGALLVHLIPAALLVLYIHWPPRLPLPQGSPVALNVELAPLSSAVASSPQQAASQPQSRQAPATRSQLAAVDPVRPLGEMHPLPQPEAAPSSAAPAADGEAVAAPAESSDLGASGASDPDLQLWLDQIVARLASYKDYPSSALQQMQQDTVMLQFSVDPTGRVTYSQVDSPHHYQALEQEVQRMLRLVGTMPKPPPRAAGMVVGVPVQFSLDFMPNLLCGAAGCPSGHGAQSAPKAVAPPPPTLSSCTAPASLGPAPAGATATLEQMRAYRERLNQYLAAGGSELACLSQVRETSTLALRDTLTRQLHSLVDGFNAAARVFEATAQARALQAQQARQRQTQALAARVYTACTAPPVSRLPGALTAAGAQAFRRQLIGYQSAVRRYVACLRQADLAAAAPERGLAGDQRAQLAQTALQLGDAAILSFNQLAGRFNAQVPHLRQQALAALTQQNLAEALVRGAAIFPSSIWDLPVPLPTGECVDITQSGQSYRAQLCNPTYLTSISDLSQQLKSSVNQPYLSPGQAMTKAAVDMDADIASGLPAEALQQEAIAAEHGFPADANPKCATQYCPPPVLGIAVTTQAGFAGQVTTGPRQQAISYSVSELQVAGRHISMTISRRSDADTGGDALSAIHLDLVLSPDNQTLYGYCWTGQQRRECTLSRHTSAPAARTSPR